MLFLSEAERGRNPQANVILSLLGLYFITIIAGYCIRNPC